MARPMRDRFENLVGRPKPVHPHAWLWAPLEDDPTFVLRSMFGAKAAYLDGRLMLCFCAGGEPWRGVLACTDRTRHESLRAAFPQLAPHPILSKWLYLPESDDAFESAASRLVSLARMRDPRLGVVPGTRKNRGATRQKQPKHFKSAAAFREWLETHHATSGELWVGLYNRTSGRGGITYPQALDEALCFGWIDGLRKRVDDDRYMIRFTPRKPLSVWSRINIGHVKRLIAARRMRPPGLAAFAARDPKKTAAYSFEQRPQNLPPALERVFHRNRRAWAFWESQPPGYRRIVTWYVISAKQETTRRRRLDRVIADSAAGRRIGILEQGKRRRQQEEVRPTTP